MPSKLFHLSQDRRLSNVFFTLAFLDICKHAIVLFSGLDQPWGDSVPYWIWGGDIASGDVAMLRSQIGYRTLGYPWFVGVCRSITDDFALFTVAVFQHLVCLVTDLLGAIWLRRISRVPGVAVLGYGLMVANTSRAMHANWVLTESVATFTLLATVVLVCSAWHTPSIGKLLGAAALIGAAILVRPSSLVLLPLLVPLIMRRKSHKLAGGLAAMAVVGLFLSPCYIRNYALFGRAELVTFQGRELWAAMFSPWPGGDLPIPADGAGGELRRTLQDVPNVEWRRNWSVSSSLARLGVPDADIDREMSTVAWQAVWRDPLRAGSRFLVRLVTYWYCWNWPAESTSAEHRQVFADQHFWAGSPPFATIKGWLNITPEWFRWTTVVYSAVTCIGVICMWRRPQTRTAGAVVGYVLLATTILTAGLEIPTYRYRMPLEPLMMVAISCAMAELVPRRQWPN